jgi:ABC-type antimicrobial peptide transport system permease subunit
VDLPKAPGSVVIAVVKDIRPGYGSSVRPSVYAPLNSQQFRSMTIFARTSGDPLALAAAMRTEAQRLDPRVVIPRPEPLTVTLASDLADTAFQATLFGMFGLLGVVIAAVGIYGVMGYWVGTRMREMGVRLALGATPEQLRGLVVRQASVPLLAGLCAGLAGAFALTRRLESLLYGVTPNDPVTLGSVFLILLLVGLGAAYLPARHAARVDPVLALRAE